jgi:hypothetical protein
MTFVSRFGQLGDKKPHFYGIPVVSRCSKFFVFQSGEHFQHLPVKLKGIQVTTSMITSVA